MICGLLEAGFKASPIIAYIFTFCLSSWAQFFPETVRLGTKFFKCLIKIFARKSLTFFGKKYFVGKTSKVHFNTTPMAHTVFGANSSQTSEVHTKF